MKALSALCGLSLCIAGIAHAGVIVHQTEHVKVLGSSSDGQSVLYVQNGLVRTERLDARGHLERFTLFRDGAIWQVDPTAHAYKKLDRAGIEKMMAQVPPPARAMFEKLRASRSSQHESWQDTGRSDRVGTFTCRVWEGSPAGTKESACVAPFSALPGGDELGAALRQVSVTINDITSALPTGAGNLNVFARYSRFNGLPVSSRTSSGETRVVSAEKKSLSMDLFQVPAGYQQQPMTLK